MAPGPLHLDRALLLRTNAGERALPLRAEIRAARLALADDRLELGEVRAHQRAQGELRLRNDGNAPLAARVDGAPILLEDYTAELTRLQAAEAEQGLTSSPEAQRQQVLDALINETLLAQSAAQAGLALSDAALQQAYDGLIADLGSPAALTDWQARNGYTDESFRRALRRSLDAAAQRDAIIATVPEQTEQILARQILARTPEGAAQALSQLNGGADFEALALTFDPTTGGMLGWFPQGYLLQPTVEDAVFMLQPGQYTDVIQTEIGYHIVLVIQRELHPLSPEARLVLQQNQLNRWMTSRRSTAAVEILVP